jgi:cytochrome P450
VVTEVPGVSPTDLLDPAVLEDPYPFYRSLRQHAPLWRVPGTKVFLATSFEVIDEITIRPHDFSSVVRTLLYRGEDGLPQQLDFGAGVEALASSDPPVHTAHRKAVFPELVARKMAELAPDIDVLTNRFLDDYLPAGGGDFMSAVGNMVPIKVISSLIGFQNSDPLTLLKAAEDGTVLVGGTLSLEELTPVIERTLQIGGWITEQLSAAVAADDVLLGTIRRGVEAGDLSLEQGVIILQTLLSAGGESTTSLIGNAVRILAELPDLQDQLRREPQLVPTFVEEALRVESPFRMQMRSVPADTNCRGVEVPAGSTVMLFFAAANRDPAHFTNPDLIDLARPNPRVHLAFGRGLHFCVGAHLARVEAIGVLTALLARTRSFRLDPTDPPVRVQSLLARRHARLPLLLANTAPRGGLLE